MIRPIKAEAKAKSSIAVVKDLYSKYAAARPERKQIDLTDVVTLQVKAKR